MQVQVKNNNEKAILKVIVVALDNTLNLLGRNLDKIKLNWQQVFSTTSSSSEAKQDSGSPSLADQKLNEILKKHAQVFEEGFGTFKDTNAKIVVEGNAHPMQLKRILKKKAKETRRGRNHRASHFCQ